MIQLLGQAGAGSSMIMTDPKGELFSLHSKHLVDNGYDVKVIDLRDTYSSYRWNPLDAIWDLYQKYATAQNDVYKRLDDVEQSNLIITGNVQDYKNAECWYEFNGKAYVEYNNLINAIKVYKKKTFDEVYEDLNDLVSVLIPIENEKDPMWEKGARAITLATLLAMLEDSEKPELNMTKEKYNFFNLAKILQNSNNDYLELRKYFAGRSPLSKALSLSKQVCDAAENTRASYMSIVYEKLTLFNDSGICALTSSSDFVPENLANKKTALFLKIPDEKDTRHNLAAIFILNIYKSLIKIASSYEDLSLPRNVYFILDEFGNMPKIEKFDKMITVGRSRKIWFNMIIQSYAQLNNVYGDTVADIVKGNCGIKMFIGSNDMNTCKEYSELCGNITVVTKTTSSSDREIGINTSAQTQVRPLIYPSELQRLNKPGDIGHSIIVTFGNYPFMTYFTPSFKVPLYKTGKMDTSELSERLFDEKAVFYNIANRNKIISEYQERAGKSKKEINKVQLEEQVAKESIEENNFVENVAAEQKQELDELTSLNIRNEFKQMLKKYNIDAKTAIDKIVVDLMKERNEEVSEE
jgi:type IV secretion system protein VirD4